MGQKNARFYHFVLVNIQLCPNQVVAPVKIMPSQLVYECGIACGTTCDKVPMANMITMKDLIIISHSYYFCMKNGMHLQLTLKALNCLPISGIQFVLFPDRYN